MENAVRVGEKGDGERDIEDSRSAGSLKVCCTFSFPKILLFVFIAIFGRFVVLSEKKKGKGKGRWTGKGI